MKRLLFALTICGILLNANYLSACAVAFNSTANSSVLSYNMDWFWLGGGIFTRAENQEHKSLTWEKGAKWKSKYKSVVLSTLTDDQPFSGVNEKGLTVHCLGTPQQIIDNRKGLPVLNELETINYILDTAKDVKEAKAQLAKIKVSPIAFPLHYFICDKKDCIAVDFKGKMTIRPLKKKMMVLTNSYYDEALEYAYAGAAKDSDPRFLNLLNALSQKPEDVREAIRSVEQAGGIIETQWNSTIRNLPNGKSELVISILPAEGKKAKDFTISLDDIFSQDFSSGQKWISFDNMLKKKLAWNAFTEADAKKLIKFNINQILENKDYVLSRNKEPEDAEKNVKSLEKILNDKHLDNGKNCTEIMQGFIFL